MSLDLLKPLPKRICLHEACGEVITDNRRLFCSFECRAIHYAVDKWGCRPQEILRKVSHLYFDRK